MTSYETFAEQIKKELVAYFIKPATGEYPESPIEADARTLTRLITQGILVPENGKIITEFQGPLPHPAFRFTLGSEVYILSPRSNYLHINGEEGEERTFNVKAGDYTLTTAEDEITATSRRKAAIQMQELCDEDEVTWKNTYDSLHSSLEIEEDDIT